MRWIYRLSVAFVALLAALLAGSLIAQRLEAQNTAPASAAADLILKNTRIYTVDAKNSVAQAVAVAGGRIVAVGTNDEIAKLKGPATQELDLAGKIVTPGLTDSHGHMVNLGLSLTRLSLAGTKSYEEVIAKVVERAKSLPAGAWILGRGWDQNQWPVKDFPDARALSAAVSDHPVWLIRVDGHAGLANDVAMKIAGVTAATADPEGGKIVRRAGASGAGHEPLGVFVDNAKALIESKVPAESGSQIRNAMELAIRECLRYGLTSVHDPGVDGKALDIYKQMIDDGDFAMRDYAMLLGTDAPAVDQYFKSGPLLDYGDHHLTVRSVKVWIDGALGSRGAALLEPYADDPKNTGLLVIKPEFLKDLTHRALAAGFQVCCHAIGDRGNRLVLDTFEEALKDSGKTDTRLRIEHAQVVALSDIPRFARLGVIPAMQATHATSDMGWAEARLGPERIKGAYAWRRFIDAGCKIADGSDFPVEGVNPLWGFYAAITRQDKAGNPPGGWMPDQCMTRLEALQSFTINAAYAAFQEKELGSIEPGKLADFTVLDQDIMQIPPPEILKTNVEMTIVGGKPVYRR